MGIMTLLSQLVRGLASYFEHRATQAQIELNRLAITETERIEDEIKELEHQISQLRADRNPDSDRLADELRVRAGRRATLLASVARGLPLPLTGQNGAE